VAASVEPVSTCRDRLSARAAARTSQLAGRRPFFTASRRHQDYELRLRVTERNVRTLEENLCFATYVDSPCGREGADRIDTRDPGGGPWTRVTYENTCAASHLRRKLLVRINLDAHVREGFDSRRLHHPIIVARLLSATNCAGRRISATRDGTSMTHPERPGRPWTLPCSPSLTRTCPRGATPARARLPSARSRVRLSPSRRRPGRHLPRRHGCPPRVGPFGAALKVGAARVRRGAASSRGRSRTPSGSTRAATSSRGRPRPARWRRPPSGAPPRRDPGPAAGRRRALAPRHRRAEVAPVSRSVARGGRSDLTERRRFSARDGAHRHPRRSCRLARSVMRLRNAVLRHAAT